MSRAAHVLLVLLLCAGCGATEPRSEPRLPERGGPWPGAGGLAEAHAAARRAAVREVRRRAELRRLRGKRTVAGALRRALLARRISAAAHERMRRDWAAARAALGRLGGVRRAELAAVVATTRRLAARQALHSSRLEPTFLVVRRNTAFWTRAALPAAGARTSFGRDPAIFQYYPGRGMQLQPLAGWGRANGMAHACLRAVRARRPAHPCRRRALTRTLDALTALGAERGGFLAWEYYFAYGGGSPPWISGMTQATAVQALVRGWRALKVRRWRRAAQRALGAFERPSPVGVSARAPGGRHYLMYSFDPGLRILNGNLQAVSGLRDLAALGPSRRAARLFRRGERAARRAVARYDTGAWSLYSARGREATLPYHQLVGGFLGELCSRTGRAAYCRAQRRFARYEREPTRIEIATPRRPRARRPVPVTFSLSKMSRVAVRLWSTRGLSLRRDLDLPRGRHRLAWSPPGRGRYRLRIEARGPSGPAGVELRTIHVTRPRPPRRRVSLVARRREATRRAGTRDRGSARSAPAGRRARRARG